MKPGDIGLVAGKKKLAKIIQFWMKVYCFVLGEKVKQVYNHAFLVIVHRGVLKVAEMVVFDKYHVGLRVIPFEETEYYDQKYGEGFILRRPVFEVTPEMVEMLTEEVMDFTCENLRYDFINPPQQIIKAFTIRWIGKKGLDAEKKQQCAEFVATAWNKVKKIFNEPWAENPMDLYLTKQFYTLKKLED